MKIIIDYLKKMTITGELRRLGYLDPEMDRLEVAYVKRVTNGFNDWKYYTYWILLAIPVVTLMRLIPFINPLVAKIAIFIFIRPASIRQKRYEEENK